MTAVDDCGVCGGVNACAMRDALVLTAPALTARLCANGRIVANATEIAAISNDLAHILGSALLAEANAVTITALSCPAAPARRRALAPLAAAADGALAPAHEALHRALTVASSTLTIR
jgi:hypothetical protein